MVTSPNSRGFSDLNRDIFCNRPQRRRQKNSCCLQVKTPIDRPDPAIYSQKEQFSLGVQPTWNSPDITTNFIGQNKLLPEAQVTVYNRSATASAIGVQVNAFVSRFGIGFSRTPIGASIINLNPLQTQVLPIPFPQVILRGEQRISFFVRLEHSSDSTLINNEGAQILDALATSQQGRTINTSFIVRNPLSVPQNIQVQILSTHSGIQASFAISSGTFGPFEERTCSVQIAIESWLVGGEGTVHDREVTFVARGEDGRIIDGLTFYVAVDS